MSCVLYTRYTNRHKKLDDKNKKEQNREEKQYQKNKKCDVN